MGLSERGSAFGSALGLACEFAGGVGWVSAASSATTTVLALRNSRMPTAESSRP